MSRDDIVNKLCVGNIVQSNGWSTDLIQLDEYYIVDDIDCLCVYIKTLDGDLVKHKDGTPRLFISPNFKFVAKNIEEFNAKFKTKVDTKVTPKFEVGNVVQRIIESYGSCTQWEYYIVVAGLSGGADCQDMIEIREINGEILNTIYFARGFKFIAKNYEEYNKITGKSESKPKFEVGNIIQRMSHSVGHCKLGEYYVVRSVQGDYVCLKTLDGYLLLEYGSTPDQRKLDVDNFRFVAKNYEEYKKQFDLTKVTCTKPNPDLVWLNDHYHTYKQFKDLLTTKEESNMSNRRTVKVELFDNDKGLDVEHSLVYFIDSYLTDDSNENVIREIISSGDVAAAVQEHNTVRQQQTDLDILNRTGNDVKLRPIKLRDLTWVIDGKTV